MKNKFIAVVLMIMCFTLSSCTNNEGEALVATPISTTQTLQTQTKQDIEINLYFYTSTNNNFTRESRVVEREDNTSLAEIALTELFKGPTAENGVRLLSTNISLKKLEISEGTVNVYLNKGAFDGLSELDQVKARFAIYYTLKDLEDIQYVNVYVGDNAPGYNYKPFGTLKKYNLNDYKSEFLNEAASAEQTVQKRNVTLYFANQNGDYILPEVRTITINDNSYVISVIDELIAGPTDRTITKGILTSECQITTANITTVDGVRTLSLKFKKLPLLANTSGLKSEDITYASIVYTLTGFLVDIDKVVIYNGNDVVYTQVTAVKNIYHTRTMYSKYLGTQIALYYPDTTKKQLYKVLRTVYNGDAQNPVKVLTELFKGPNDKETSLAWPVLPQGITAQDILSVQIKGTVAYVDLSENFYTILQQNKSSEFITAFSIVNTLCDIPGVKKVQFLMNGQKRDLLVDKIKIANPIYPDYGIINFTY